ncbi:MAG: fructose-bisphosphate aldolase class I [Candidatus Magasanikbacteria bacterium]|nr:fructose-bisphosphate aldolase class I [Candidatus Magasanikbacteria bacterium]
MNLFDETIRQSTSDGVPFVEYLSAKGVVPGIKVDIGLKEMEGHVGEQITKWDDALDSRLKEYYQMGARFAKWRAVITIGENIPSDECILENCKNLTEYARLCQSNNIVPIVEPEVLMDGAHTIERCEEVTHKTLSVLFAELKKANIDLSGLILKPNMVISGLDGEKVSSDVIAQKTVQCFKETVPAEVAGIVFLSGGQSEAESCENLSAISKLAKEQNAPWKLTFSYGRALQNSAIKNWLGKDENKTKSQEIFAHRAKLASAASKGEYSADME